MYAHDPDAWPRHELELEIERLKRAVEKKDEELKNTRDQLYDFLYENKMPKKRIEYFLQDIDKAIAYDGSEEWHTIKPK